jgi:uncharacterized protein (DUF1015 family)
MGKTDSRIGRPCWGRHREGASTAPPASMMRVRPFRAFRPAPDMAAGVAVPPYDVVSRDEAARLAADNPESFLRVTRAEITLPAHVDPHDPRVYGAGRDGLARLIDRGTLRLDADPSLYIYRLAVREREQVGVVGCVHVDDYEAGVIRKHENTRPDKEDDRTRHILSVGAHCEPVLLVHRDRTEIDRLAAEAMHGPPLEDFTAPDGVRHTVWRAPAPDPWVEAFGRIQRAYVADGHHRCAGAWRAAGARRARPSRDPDDAEYDWFPAVLFPASQVQILPYNRLVRDLKGQTPAQVVERLGRLGRLSLDAAAEPPRPGSFALYLDHRWHLLELDTTSIDRSDAIGSLDVSLLQERVLGPVLGIGDPRTDPRLEFVGGSRGTHELEARVNAGEMALAISMYPTTVEQLMTVADRGSIMPPKSTWFEPKLASGLFVHLLD